MEFKEMLKYAKAYDKTCAFSMNNGEYVPGAGTAHSFIGNAASNWGLTCERVGKDRMDYVVQSLKEGKMVVEICEAYHRVFSRTSGK